MKNKLSLLYLCLGLLLLLPSCKEDEEMLMEEEQAVMEIKKNDTDYTISEFNNTLLEVEQAGNMGRRLDIRFEVDGGTLILSVSNWSWQNPPEDGIVSKTYVTNSNGNISSNTACSGGLCDGGLGTYSFNGGAYYSEGITEEGEGQITISSNDTEKKEISGSVEIIVKNFALEEKVAFKGTFKNLPYSVQ